MTTVVSNKNSKYNEFFSEVISMIDEQYTKPPKILVVALPDGEDAENHLSTYGMDTLDMFQMASLVLHEATKFMLDDALDKVLPNIDDEDYDELDEEEIDNNG